MNNLHDKLALVTGGGSGINLAFCKILHSAGCKVLIADISLHPQAREWLLSIPSVGSGVQVSHVQADVTNWAQLENTFDVAASTFGRVPDIVVPGAGVYEPSSNSFWADQDTQSHYKVLDINLVHPIKMSRIAIRRWVQAGKKGTILHVSSIAGQRSSIVTPLYTVSKHGINSFVRGMAPLEELAGIRVVGVAPGTVGTPLFTEHPEAAKFLNLEKDFLLKPAHVANAMFALLTKSEYKSGTILEICHPTKWREVSLLNDAGPQGPASSTSRKSEAVNDIMQYLNLENQGDTRSRANISTD